MPGGAVFLSDWGGSSSFVDCCGHVCVIVAFPVGPVPDAHRLSPRRRERARLVL